MKKVVIGGFFHESNSFNPIITPKEDFVVYEGEDLLANSDQIAMIKGFVDYFKDDDQITLVPSLFARAVPNGIVAYDFYNEIKQKIFKYLENTPKVDAILLALHGSMRVEKIGDAEGDFLEELRAKYPNIPIVASLDMHATISEKMTKNADGFVGFKTAPHIDQHETSTKAAEILSLMLQKNTAVYMSYQKIPYLIAGEKSETSCFPMNNLIAKLKEFESDDEIIAASYLLGFPWADAEGNGVTPLVVAKNKEKADQVAQILTEEFKNNRNNFSFSAEAYSAKESILLALEQADKLTFVSDSGDNPTAGSSGDNTSMLQTLEDLSEELEVAKKSIVYAGIFDPTAVSLCKENLNKEIELTLGAKFDQKHSNPIKIKGKVLKYITKWGVYQSDLVLFATKNYDLLITAKHVGFVTPEILEAVGVDVFERDITILKLGYLTDAFKKIAKKAIMALTKGCTDEELARLDYKVLKDHIKI